MKSWLITWEEMGEVEEVLRVAAVLNYRWSSHRILQVTEHIYVNATASPGEMLAFVRDPRTWPYRAEYMRFGGVAWMGSIMCGHNPALYARMVDKLRIEAAAGEEHLVWQELALSERVRAAAGLREEAAKPRSGRGVWRSALFPDADD